jgi:peptide deformylase
MKILKHPHPTLVKKAEPITHITTDIITLAGNMLFTMNENKGIGLAAPQVDKLLQLIVVDTRAVEPTGSLEFLINPVILNKEGEASIDEGCLSFSKKKTVKVPRAATIQVEFTGLDNKKVTKVFTGITAICVQHEIDHLLGITMDHYEDKNA